jgi:hypothetical protein
LDFLENGLVVDKVGPGFEHIGIGVRYLGIEPFYLRAHSLDGGAEIQGGIVSVQGLEFGFQSIDLLENDLGLRS